MRRVRTVLLCRQPGKPAFLTSLSRPAASLAPWPLPPCPCSRRLRSPPQRWPTQQSMPKSCWGWSTCTVRPARSPPLQHRHARDVSCGCAAPAPSASCMPAVATRLSTPRGTTAPTAAEPADARVYPSPQACDMCPPLPALLFAVVEEDGSPHGPKTFVMWNPPLRQGGPLGALSRTEERARGGERRSRRAAMAQRQRARQQANQERGDGELLHAVLCCALLCCAGLHCAAREVQQPEGRRSMPTRALRERPKCRRAVWSFCCVCQ